MVYLQILSVQGTNTGPLPGQMAVKLSVDLEKLENDGWIKLGEDVVHLRERFFSLKGNFEQQWAALLSRFPIKVSTKEGVRVLRAADPDSNSNAKAKKKYKAIVSKSPGLHERILKGLEIELALKRQTNSLGYMQMLDTWINNSTWEKYLSSDVKSNSDTDESNSGRITRLL
jgi:hypothetical protein